MAVQVDETRQHVVAFELEHAVTVAHFRATVLLDRRPRRSDRDDIGDPVAFDDDVHRPERRGAGAVDERHSPEDQTVERPLALGARRRGFDLRG